MAQVLYCLECNLVLGEVGEGDGESPEGWVAVCQTCAQHRPAPSGRPLSPVDTTPDDLRASPIRSLPGSAERHPGTLGFMRAATIWQRVQTVLVG